MENKDKPVSNTHWFSDPNHVIDVQGNSSIFLKLKIHILIWKQHYKESLRESPQAYLRVRLIFQLFPLVSHWPEDTATGSLASLSCPHILNVIIFED